MSVWGKPQPSRSDFSSWWMFCRSVWILCTGVLGFVVPKSSTALSSKMSL